MSRKLWVYTEGGRPLPEPIEVDRDWRNAAVSTGDLGKFQYDNLRAIDGTDISSRTKHRNYMKANGVTMASDFQGTWQDAANERQQIQSGTHDKAARHEAVGRALYERSKRR